MATDTLESPANDQLHEDTPELHEEQPVVTASEAVEVQTVGRSIGEEINTTTLEGSLLAKIKAKELIVGDKLRVYNSLKHDAKEAKKEYDEEVSNLRSLIRSAGERLPLFDKPFENKPADEAAAPVENTAWRDEPISVLSLAAKVEEKFIEAGYDTIGKLEDLRASDQLGGGLRSVKGIGEATADKIEDAIIGWLTEHRDAAVLSSNGACPDTAESVLARYAEIEAAGDTNWTTSKDVYEGGRDAFCSGRFKVEECPWTDQPRRDDWLRGWLMAKDRAAALSAT